jgi:hypothetical protein
MLTIDQMNNWNKQGKPCPLQDSKLRNYVDAIVRYRKAIELAILKQQDQSWTYAHLGAAIANARAFVAWSNREEKAVPLLTALFETWLKFPELPDHQTSGKADRPTGKRAGSTEEKKPDNVDFVDAALKALVKAQELRGFYYPWAQAYYSGALLLKGAFIQDPDVALLGQLQTAMSYYLQPEILGDLFEPGQLSVNPMFEMAAILVSMGDAKQHDVRSYDKAWTFAWIGMKWLFKSSFQAGLYGLSGYHVLVTIASRIINKKAQGPKTEPSTFDDLLKKVMLDGTSDLRPGADRRFLYDLIRQAYETCLVPDFGPWLKSDFELDSNVTMGLVKALFILDDFINVYPKNLGEKLKDGQLKQKLKDLKKRIEDKLELQMMPEGSDKIVPGVLLPHASLRSLTGLNELDFDRLGRLAKQ